MNILDYLDWCIIDKYNWDFISVIIDILNYFIIITTAIITFMYLKIKRLKIITIKDIGGRNIIIQNISKNTVFIKNITVIVKNKDTKQRRKINFEDLPDEIEPKSFHKFSLDYGVHDIEKNNIVHIKINLHSKYTYIKRIK